jgi:hypothetical protein
LYSVAAMVGKQEECVAFHLTCGWAALKIGELQPIHADIFPLA